MNLLIPARVLAISGVVLEEKPGQRRKVFLPFDQEQNTIVLYNAAGIEYPNG